MKKYLFFSKISLLIKKIVKFTNQFHLRILTGFKKNKFSNNYAVFVHFKDFKPFISEFLKRNICYKMLSSKSENEMFYALKLENASILLLLEIQIVYINILKWTLQKPTISTPKNTNKNIKSLTINDIRKSIKLKIVHICIT